MEMGMDDIQSVGERKEKYTETEMSLWLVRKFFSCTAKDLGLLREQLYRRAPFVSHDVRYLLTVR